MVEWGFACPIDFWLFMGHWEVEKEAELDDDEDALARREEGIGKLEELKEEIEVVLELVCSEAVVDKGQVVDT